MCMEVFVCYNTFLKTRPVIQQTNAANVDLCNLSTWSVWNINIHGGDLDDFIFLIFQTSIFPLLWSKALLLISNMVVFRSQNTMKLSQITAHILYIFSKTSIEILIMTKLSRYIAVKHYSGELSVPSVETATIFIIFWNIFFFHQKWNRASLLVIKMVCTGRTT